MTWIFGRFQNDFMILAAPGFLALLLSVFFIGQESYWFLIYAFLVTTVIDSGHAYNSVWRTFVYPSGSGRRALYLLIFIAISLLGGMWIYLGVPYFWAFVIYFTFYHHIRQFYGISKWYQKKSGRSCLWSDRYLYILTILPFVAFHFRSFSGPLSIYSNQDLFFVPSAVIFLGVVLVYTIFLIGWAIFEYRLLSTKGFEPGRFFGLLVPIALHGICFIWARNLAEIIFPLLAVHGVAYIGLMSLSVQKVTAKGTKRLGWTVGLSLLLAAGLGVFDEWFQQLVLVVPYQEISLSVFQAWLVALAMTPTLWHYAVDGLIWKAKDPQAQLIYG